MSVGTDRQRRRSVVQCTRELPKNPEKQKSWPNFSIVGLWLLTLPLIKVIAFVEVSIPTAKLPSRRPLAHCSTVSHNHQNRALQSQSDGTREPFDCAPLGRRNVLLGSLVGASVLLAGQPLATYASSEVYTRETNQFTYTFSPPIGFPGPSQKPLKTHLDEVNFASTDISEYQFGITVDPVRIASLKEFGTPEEVAAKVVLAEVNRDGVLSVTLMEDPVAIVEADTGALFYLLNYVSSGKRGDKRFIARFVIANQKLFALTAQCKDENYDDLRSSMLRAVNSFRVVS
jgi:PsbP